MDPSLARNTEPAQALRDRVTAGHLGMKTGAGFFDWPADKRDAERRRYDTLLRRGLDLLADELPPIDRNA
jgi:3-hydroxybutyryl-CoA dehydrogenase